MTTQPLHVYCADIGAMCNRKRKNHFGWASHEKAPCCNGKDMRGLVKHVAQDLAQGSKVELGFECPEWIPVRDCPEELTQARKGERRSWSASAGAGSLATGLAQVAWILQEIRRKAPDGATAFLKWDDYQKSDNGLFIWEAYVAGPKNQTTDTEDPHIRDAKAAVAAFVKTRSSDSGLRTSIFLPPCSQPFSLIGAALLWARWSEDSDLLRQSCVVIKA